MQILATVNCGVLTTAHFGWQGNWEALFPMCYCLALGILGLRYAAVLGARSSMPATATTNTRIASVGTLAICVFLVKVAFFSAC
jgi:hypothetical protein